MYSNDQRQIRAGMINYIGSLLRAEKVKGLAGKQDVVAILTEEALNIASTTNKVIDYYVAKPILKAAIIILTQYKNELVKNKETLNLSNDLSNTINLLNKFVSTIK